MITSSKSFLSVNICLSPFNSPSNAKKGFTYSLHIPPSLPSHKLQEVEVTVTFQLSY